MKIAVLCRMRTRSSWVMHEFDNAGFRLGRVDRQSSEKYPAGRLELLDMAPALRNRSKYDPIKRHLWPEINFSEIDVVKCMPAAYEYFKANGFNYWILATRGAGKEMLSYPHDDHIETDTWDGNVEKYREVLNQ